MEKELLEKVFGVGKEYELLGTECKEEGVEFHLGVREEYMKCPRCGDGPGRRRGARQRRLLSVPIGSMKTEFVVEVPRCQCKKCGHEYRVPPFLPLRMSTIPKGYAGLYVS